jgi:hypothetical protein
LFTEPIYYEGKKKAIFPNVMSVVLPTNERRQYKINRYTIIDGDASHSILTGVKLNYALIDAFLYDGHDVYFFPDGGKITYGDKTVEISKFSFVRCENGGALYIYDYGKNELIFEEETKGNVFAHFDKYKINIAFDTIYVNDEPSLLNRNVNSLKKLN